MNLKKEGGLMKLYPHQEKALKDLKDLSKVALYWDMGL